MMDLHRGLKPFIGVAPIAVGTTGTGQAGKIIDRRGYAGVEFYILYGSITATNATCTVTVKEGDATGTMTSVADADLDGTEAAAGIAATTPRTSGVSKNVFKRLRYIGTKRYVQCGVKSTISAAIPIAVLPLAEPYRRPVAT